MTGTHDDKDALEMFFEAGRTDPSAAPSDALMQRVMADAIKSQPAPVPSVRMGRRGTNPLAGIIAALGGWRPVTGLVAVTLAGAWIGFGLSASYLPAGLDSLTGSDAEIYLSELSDGFDLAIESEGS